ncbi:glycosyl transferase, group 1 family protein [Synechococcus sp. PCC 7335]|uniref:glycosyltransferase n=1 Tax=Synechococcus sp. (strain ATCC 29403 / PCC 7335) TaxID=91464 RepID=UPI00017EC3D9|nr:glycosyltransferase [Synechococcus sp. PCC 7335]EDX84868.1 glycosyl transferase, group 1 family protein [Synechococcus sp. PCC 7335]
METKFQTSYQNVAFTVGTGRCGTQFLSRILSLEPKVASVHERNPFNETFHRYCKWYGIPIDHEGFLQTKEQEIQADFERYAFSVESSAHLSLSIKELYERFNAKFVLLVRRPDQVVNSYRYKGWYSQPVVRSDIHLPPSYQSSHESHHFLGRIFPSGEVFERWRKMTQVGKLAWYWNELNRQVLQQFSAIPQSHWRIQKLEDLSYTQYLEIAQFIGFPSHVSEGEYQQLATRRPNATSHTSYQEKIAQASGTGPRAAFTVDMWNPTEIAEFESAVAAVAAKLGYQYEVDTLLKGSQDSLSEVSNKAQPSDKVTVDVSRAKSAPDPDLESLIYVSNGNLPSKMAHNIQVAKMSQALSKCVNSFELVTAGDIASFLRGMDEAFREWYGIHSPYRLVRLPLYRKFDYPFPIDHVNPFFCRVASLYTYWRSPELVYTRSPKVVDFMLALQVPVLWEEHELLTPPFPKHLTDRLTHKDLVGFVTLSKDIAQGYIEAGLSPEKVMIAHSGVDLESFRPNQEKSVARQKLGLPQDEKIVLYAGHLYEYKGIPTLIETAQLLPQHRFVLVGGWEADVERTRTFCQAKAVDNVSLMGHVEHSQLATYLYAADVLVIPNSRSWRLATTTSPLKLFEYMAIRRPIVASALPNIVTVLRDHDNALLAEPDNPHSFKEAIAKLLADPALSEQIVIRAAQDVQRYTWEKRSRRILRFANSQLQQMERAHHSLIYRTLVILKILIFH